jgi:hypothetical protein
MTTKLDVSFHFLFIGRELIRNINAPFSSLEIHGAVQFYLFFFFLSFFFFFFQFYLKEENKVEINENLMTKKLDVSIHFLFNIRELISHIKCTVFFKKKKKMHRLFYLNMHGPV